MNHNNLTYDNFYFKSSTTLTSTSILASTVSSILTSSSTTTKIDSIAPSTLSDVIVSSSSSSSSTSSSNVESSDLSIFSSILTLDTILTLILPYSIIFVLSIIGNLLVIITITWDRSMRSVTNIFLLNLAISDLLLGVFCMPFTLVGVLLKRFIFGKFMCHMISYFQAVSVAVSVWTLVAMSIERYYAICHPFRSREFRQTKKHAYRMLAFVWTMASITMLPTAIVTELQITNQTGYYKCREAWPSFFHKQIFTIFLDFVLLIIPLIIMIMTYSLIALTLRKNVHQQPNQKELMIQPQQQSNLTTTKHDKNININNNNDGNNGNGNKTMMVTNKISTNTTFTTTTMTTATTTTTSTTTKNNNNPNHYKTTSFSNSKNKKNNNNNNKINFNNNNNNNNNNEHGQQSHHHQKMRHLSIRGNRLLLTDMVENGCTGDSGNVNDGGTADEEASRISSKINSPILNHHPNSHDNNFGSDSNNVDRIPEESTPTSTFQKRFVTYSRTNGNSAHHVDPCNSSPYASPSANHNKNLITTTTATVLRISHSSSAIPSNRQRRIITMLFVVVIEFFICWSPIFLLDTMALYRPQMVYGTSRKVSEWIGIDIISVCHLLCFCSSCTNPITYCFMNQRFRYHFMSLFHCRRMKNSSSMNSNYVVNSVTAQT